MPRTARLDTPGLLHHVMLRGIERRKIFRDNKDRDNFIERLSFLLPETKTQCYARRPELVGGGLIRSIGGWDEIKKIRLTGQDRIKSDQRILGESNFVMEVLSESEERLAYRYELRGRGFNYEKAVERVSLLFALEEEYITGKGRQQDRVRARDLLCYWCAIKLGISMTELTKKLDLTLAAVSFAVKRGEKIAKEGNFILED